MVNDKPKEKPNALTSVFCKNRLSRETWRDLAATLLDYVFDPQRKTVIGDYGAITELLSERWRVHCVEVETAIQGVAFLKTAGEQLARFSIRLLYLLYPPQYYIAVNQALSPAEKTLAILHELGHMALHLEVLQSIGTLYHRICMNPELELFLGRSQTLINELLAHQEEEADLFAVTWLLPLTVDGEFHLQALTADGRREQLRRQVFSDSEGVAKKAQNTPAWNALGDATRRGLSPNYPQGGSLVQRVTWIVFNRDAGKNIAQKRQALVRDYFNVIGQPGLVPELAQPAPAKGSGNSNDYAWIPRVDIDDLLSQVDSDHWEPFLAGTKKHGVPYYVPITPVPSRQGRDSELGWVNMSKASHSAPQQLSEWLAKAKRNDYMLMVFPRTPAERIMDAQNFYR